MGGRRCRGWQSTAFAWSRSKCFDDFIVRGSVEVEDGNWVGLNGFLEGKTPAEFTVSFEAPDAAGVRAGTLELKKKPSPEGDGS